MRIERKLLLGFLIVVLSVVIVGSIGVISSIHVRDIFLRVKENEFIQLIEAVKMESAARQASIKALEYSLRKEENEIEKTREALSKIDSSLAELTARAGQQFSEPDYKNLLKTIETQIATYKTTIQDYLNAASQEITAEEIFTKEEQVHVARKELIHTLYDLIDYENKRLSQALSLVNDSINYGMKIVLSLCLLGIFIAAAVGYYLSRSITKPLRKFMDISNDIGTGNLERRVDITSNDEFGQLSITFNKMIDDLRQHINKDKQFSLEEKAKLTSQIQQAQKMESIGTLAAGIAHDFNNILTVIFGYTNMALYNIPENSPARNDLDSVLKASDRAKNLVRQILTFSRESELALQQIKPHAIVKEVVSLLRSAIPTTIEINHDIDPECGTILADPTQIHQVLMNLSTNAVHSMQEKGVLEISLKQAVFTRGDLVHYPEMVPGAYVRLSVSDTGVGMEQETLNRIFDPFFTTKKIGEGTGLGLSVVHGIVMAHHGMITVDSTPGKGTTFHVFFPIIETEKIQVVENDQALPTGNERILIVDDEEYLTEMWRQLLKFLGYRVTTTTSSKKALDIFRAQPEEFDLVITDQTMPGMTGAELSQELMGIRPDIPIILCTGYSSRVSIEEAIAMRIRKFFMKPVDTRQLAIAIREILDENKA